MRLSVVLILLVLIAICAGKSAKSKEQKTSKSKTTKETDNPKHKDAKHNEPHKTSGKKHDAKKKVKSKQDNKKMNQTIVETKANDTKANLTKELPSNCQSIVNDYSNGKLLMYEYKIEMSRCMKKAKADAEKKTLVPIAGYQAPYAVPAQPLSMSGQQAAPFYPNSAQAPYNQAPIQGQVPDQSQAAFVPSPMNQYSANPAPYQPVSPNMGMNAVARTNVPENPQPQPLASQANAVFDQWRASSFGAAANKKKDETPSVPNTPGNDQFAEFMKLQSSGNTVESVAPSQQAALPAAAAAQQRSTIQQQPNMFNTQPQLPNAVPAQNQAFFTQQQTVNTGPVQAQTFYPQQVKRSTPEENGDFPENP